MKKLNLWIATIASILFFFGTYFKVQHWPGASVLMLLGAIFGVVFLLMYLFGELGNLGAGSEKNTGIIGSITMILVFVGFVFKVMHWPGGNAFVYLGHAVLLLFSIFLLIDAFKETDANKQTVKALAALTVITLMSILVFLGLGSLMG